MNKILESLITLLLVSLSTCQNVPKLPVHTGKGYNLLEGDPLSHSTDPGIKKQIFFLSYLLKQETEDGKYLIPDGSTSNKEETNGFSSKSEEITGSQSYQESLSQFAKVSAAYAGPIASVSFSASVGYQKAKTETSSDKKVVYLSKGECVRYTLNFPIYDTLPLDKDFISGVYNALRNKTGWFSLIDTYGTHFLDKVTLGGRMIISTSFSQKDCLFLKSKNIDIDVSLSASYYGFTGSVESKTKIANDFEKATSKMNIKNEYFYAGGKPNSESLWAEWGFIFVLTFGPTGPDRGPQYSYFVPPVESEMHSLIHLIMKFNMHFENYNFKCIFKLHCKFAF
jgi:hypothetical protein